MTDLYFDFLEFLHDDHDGLDNWNYILEYFRSYNKEEFLWFHEYKL